MAETERKATARGKQGNEKERKGNEDLAEI